MDATERMHTLIPISYGVIGTVLSWLFFQVITTCVSKYGPPKSVHKDRQWQWTNICVSLIHSLIGSCWNILCMFIIFPQMLDDLVDYLNIYIYGMVVFSVGYFFYDFMDIVVSGKGWQYKEVLLHHIAVISSFGYTLAWNKFVGYNCIALLVEINGIFLHLRKLFQMSGMNFHHPVYQINKFINIITLVMFRFGAVCVVIHGVIVHRNWFPTVFYLLILNCTIMMIINSVLFWTLLKSDLFRSGKKSHKNGVNDNVHIKDT